MFNTADKYTLQEIFAMDLPKIILMAIPVMLSLVLVEYLIGLHKKKNLYDGKDFLASAAIGIGNLITTALTNVVMFTIVWAVYYYVAPFTIPFTWWSFLLCLIVLDLCRYWAHRIAHEQRFWWATHVPHHSSEKYNFGVSFRLSWVQQFKVVFFLPVAALGFDPIVFFICHQIEVLGQFWIHTKLIKKLPAPIEYIFVTPSHHRVHHGRNEKYLDKNYGSTFIVWDRIFGTFQPEEEEPEYGITTPPNSYNPVYLVFHEFIDIARDIMRARTLKQKWTLTFAPPGTKYDEATDSIIYPEHLSKTEEEKTLKPVLDIPVASNGTMIHANGTKKENVAEKSLVD